VNDLVADRLEDRGEAGGEILVTTGEDGDLAAGCQMHAAGDRGFEGLDASGLGVGSHGANVVGSQGRELDPDGTLGQGFEQLGQDRARGIRRGQAGEHGIAVARQLARAFRAMRPESEMPVGAAHVPVVDDEVEAGPGEVGGEMATEFAEADEAETHEIAPFRRGS